MRKLRLGILMSLVQGLTASKLASALPTTISLFHISDACHLPCIVVSNENRVLYMADEVRGVEHMLNKKDVP